MEETEESSELISKSAHFVPRRRPAPLPGNPARSSRPHSIGATIISNPKLVKGWQYYDNNADERNVRRYFSTINLGAVSVDSNDETSFVDKASGNNEAIAEDHAGIEVKPEVLVPKSKTFGQIVFPTLGIILTLASSTAFAAAKVVADLHGYHPFNTLAWTSQFLFWPSLLVLIFPCQMKSISLTRRECPPTWTNTKCFTVFLIFLRGILSWMVTIIVSASESLPVPHSTARFFSSIDPIIVFPIAWICLREKCGIMPVICGGIAIIALVNIAIPMELSNFTGISLALVAVLMNSSCLVINRHLRHVHWAILTLVQGFLGVCGALYLYISYGLTNSTDFVSVAIVSFSFSTLSTNILLLGAAKFEQAGIISVVACWTVPMTIVWEAAITWEWDITTPRILGGSLILVAITILVLRKLAAVGRRSRKYLRLLLI